MLVGKCNRIIYITTLASNQDFYSTRATMAFREIIYRKHIRDVYENKFGEKCDLEFDHEHHCLLEESLWNFSVKSISDWKRDYLEECARCDVLEKCGGVFATSKMLNSSIKAIKYAC